ncbi:hypothetical protein CMO92_03430 [Candidatus Woesearchaeota archaeon]|nr:hypothetical protein [Candidatus Woesearchaeota archaeon]
MRVRKGVLLLSGGFDSPVAAQKMMKRGIELVPLHFSSVPFTDEQEEEKVRKICRHLKLSRLLVVRCGEELAVLTKECNHRLYYVLSRRLMYRVAEKIAGDEGADVLVTGENLGQVGSQTTWNMDTIDRSVSIPVLRPLLCNEKVDTVQESMRLGLFALSTGPELCSLLGPKHPLTRSREEQVGVEEQKIDVDGLVADCLKKISVVECKDE